MITLKQISLPFTRDEASIGCANAMIRPYGFKVVHGEFNQSDGIVSIVEWLVLNIGPSSDNKWKICWNGQTRINLYFSDEAYAMAFKLRWT